MKRSAPPLSTNTTTKERADRHQERRQNGVVQVKSMADQHPDRAEARRGPIIAIAKTMATRPPKAIIYPAMPISGMRKAGCSHWRAPRPKASATMVNCRY